MNSVTVASNADEKRLLAWLRDRFDDFTDFISLEVALVQRTVQLATGKSNDPILGSVRTVVIIVSHIYFFWLISRAMPAGISQVEFCTPAFTMWFLLIGTSKYHKASPIQEKNSKNLNLKWIHFTIAELIIESLKTIFAYIIVLFIFTYVYNDQRVMTMRYFPNIGKTAYLMLIAIALGFGLKLVSEYLIPRWKMFSLVLKVLMFLVYVTCGIYSSLASLPPMVAPYFVLNPLIHLTESARQAVHSGYPVWGINTLYPLILACLLIFVGLAFRRLDQRTL
jgi:ABC-type polysaccharide/polyol phosphate export permease